MLISRRLVPVLGVLAVVAFAGCSSPPSTSPSASPSANAATPSPVGAVPTVTTDSALAARVPANIKQSGRLLIATDPIFPPLMFGTPTALQGVDADLANLTTQLLGLQTQYVQVDFGSIRDTVANGTNALGWGSMTVTPERAQQVNFVTYYNAGISWITKAGSGFNPNSACGTTVAALAESVFIQKLNTLNTQCTNSGKPAIKITSVDSTAEGIALVTSNQAAATPTDSPVAASAIATSNGQLQQAGSTTDIAPLGIAVAKDSALGQLLTEAIQQLIDGGQYTGVLNRWQVPQGAIEKSELVR